MRILLVGSDNPWRMEAAVERAMRRAGHVTMLIDDRRTKRLIGWRLTQLWARLETGVVVPPEDVDAIAAAVSRYLRDDEARTRDGANGRRAVEAHFNWDRVARDTRDFTLLVAGRRAVQ